MAEATTTATPYYRAFRIFSAVVLVVVAIRHVVLAVGNDGSVARHALFVVVDLALAALLVKKPRLAWWPSLLLGLQQLVSHGLDLAQSFNGTAPLDWRSLLACIFFPTLVTVLFIERGDDDQTATDAG